jgi:TRAP-type C4-dicarboxylate transport system permease small subunit
MMRALSNAMGFIVGVAVCALLAATCVIVFAEVLSRYLGVGEMAWSDEAARFLFIWMALLGAALGVKDGSHFSINFLTDVMPLRLRAGVLLCGAVLTSFVYGVMIVEGMWLVSLNSDQMSPALGVSMSVPYFVVPLSGALMLFFTWANVAADCRTWGSGAALLDRSSLSNAVE